MLAPTRSRARALAYLFVTTSLVSGCDQYSKSQAVDALSDAPGRTVSVLEPWVDLSLAFNRGTAFSVVRDAGDGAWILAVLAIAVVAMMAWWMWREGSWARCIAAGLVAGGALGNAYDRVFREGVVDFIAVTLPGGYRWPTFNVADAALVVGVGVLLVAARDKRDEAPPPEPASA
jgi:signal peptidase II